jgi:hypothetical protein
MDTRLTTTRPLTRADRCDRCSAAAQIRATLPFGELLFCGHHVRAHLDGLLEAGAVLHPPPEPHLAW